MVERAAFCGALDTHFDDHADRCRFAGRKLQAPKGACTFREIDIGERERLLACLRIRMDHGKAVHLTASRKLDSVVPWSRGRRLRDAGKYALSRLQILRSDKTKAVWPHRDP